MIYAQIPNLLTLVRIAACPILILLLKENNHEIALYLFVIAGITDGLDGFIAKRFGYVTNFGAVLDPIADKLLIACSYIMLAILGDIPFWLLVLVMFRDLVIIAGYMILALMDRKLPANPTYTSKLNTFVQIFLVVAVLVEKSGLLNVGLIITPLIYGVMITTIVSGVQYVWLGGIRPESIERAKS